MNRLLICSAVLCLLFTLNACCHKKGCVNADKIELVRFNNFESAETDTLVFTGFVKNSGFAIQMDSFYVYSQNTNIKGVIDVYLPAPMDIQRDWQIKLQSTGTKYRVSDFVLQENICNRCITGNSYYSSLETYKINDVVQVGNIINVQK